MRILPLICMCAALIWYLTSGKDISLEDILNYSPESPAAAALFMWAAFACKSLSVMFPVMLLFAVGGRLFSVPSALAVNTVGIAVTLTLPYIIGRASGSDLTEKLMVKYPKLKHIRAERNKNSFFFSFMLRAMGILPCDVVSLYSGNTRAPYLQYIAGGVLGFMPDLICATIVGKKISEPGSPWFYVTIIINIIICALSVYLYGRHHKKTVCKAEESGHV